jgi:hypothetical protein
MLVDFPIGVRLENIETAILSLNDDYILFNDPRKVPRQIQYQNNIISPITHIAGSSHDIKVGSPSQDNFLTSSNYCDDLCIPLSLQQICTVDITVAISMFNFHTLQTAISTCPYGVIVMMNSAHYESITTNFVYTGRITTTLRVLSFSTITTIHGNHIFLQNCIPSELIPTSITFVGVIFKPTSPTPIISVVPSVSTCVYQNLIFQQTTFSINQTFANLVDGYKCEECTVSNITFTATTFTGPSKIGIYIKNLYSLQPNVKITSTVIDTSQTQAITIYTANIVELVSNVLKCQADSTTNGCVYIYNTQTNPMSIISNTISSNILNTTFINNGMTIHFLPSYVLSQLDSITSGIRLEDIQASQYGLQIIISDIDNEYPCNTTRDVYIQTLGANNLNIRGTKHNIVITDQSGIIIGYIISEATGLSCLVFDGVAAATPALLFYAILAGVFVIIGILIFLFCCNGLDFLHKIGDWNVATNTDLMTLRENRQKYLKLHNQ